MESENVLSIEDYIKQTGIIDIYNHKLSEILDMVPDSGISFNNIITNSPTELYTILSNSEEISQKMNEYVTSLDNEDMVVLSIVTDVALRYGREGGNNFTLFRTLLESTDKENFIYNFTIICIHYMKYYMLPEILKDIENDG